MIEYKEAAIKSESEAKYYYISEALGKKTFPQVNNWPSVVLIRDFSDEDVIYFPLLGRRRLRQFLYETEIAPMSRMSIEVADKFISHHVIPNTGIILYREDTKNSIDKEFIKLRKLFPSKEYSFVTSDLNTETEIRIGKVLGVKKEYFPCLIIANVDYNTINHYIYRGEIEESKLLAFFNDWKAGKVKRTLKSESIPQNDPSAIVHSISGLNFDQEVIKNDFDVIVMFYSPTCPHCMKMKPIFYELAKRFQRVKFKIIDATENEIDGIAINGYPTVILFPAGKKENPITATGNTEEYFIGFLKGKCTYPLELPPKKAEEKAKEAPKEEEKPKKDL